MKKNWWRYGIAVGLVMVAIIGSFGIKALAAGKKTMRTGADIVTGASEIESIKIVKNTYQTEGEKGILGTPEADKTEAESGNGEKTEEGESGNEADAEGGKTGETAEEGTSEDGVVSDEEAGEASESGEKTESGEEGEGAEENAEEIDAYFDDSVFIGDSIMLGFRNYAMKRQDTFLSRMNFLAAGSFSANNALWDVNDESVHPVYQGEQRQVWESVSLM